MTNSITNHKTFDELSTLIYKDIFRYIFSITRNKNLTEDVLQNVLLISYENFENLKDINKFKYWVLTIAKRETVNFLKYNNKQCYIDNKILQFAKKEISFTSEDYFLKKELYTYLKKAINKLPPNYKQVIMLKYYSKLSFNKIAFTLNLNPSTVRVWNMRAKNKLYKWLKDNYLEIDLNKTSKINKNNL